MDRNKRSFIISTPFFLGLLLFLLLALLPTLRFYQWAKVPFDAFIKELPESYKKSGFPSIIYENHTLRSDNDLPYHTEFHGDKPGEVFSLYMDTREKPDLTLADKIPKGESGAVFYRDGMTYLSGNGEKKSFEYKNFEPNLKFTLDQAFVEKFSSGLGNFLFLCLMGSIFLWYLTGKLVFWGILSLYYSGAAKATGGGNYSLALWTLVPPTLFQTVFYGFNSCCGCGAYYMILIISALIMGKALKADSPKEE